MVRARVLYIAAVLPALVGFLLLPWALRTPTSGGHGGTFTVRQCDWSSPIGWSCLGTFQADDGMACEGEPGCPTWDSVVLDEPKRRDPGAVVWATKPIGSDVVHPWGWREQDLVPLAIVAGVALYLIALVTIGLRRRGLVTSLVSAASIVFLMPVAIWMVV